MNNNKEKKETTIVHDFKINWPSPSELFIMDYNHCDLCGSELLFTHVTHFGDQKVDEEAECTSCNMKQKKKTHNLQ